jgi:hypothetical protein
MVQVWSKPPLPTSHFRYAPGFTTLILAHMLDSLVRVSRRDGWQYFVSITSLHVGIDHVTLHRSHGTACCPIVPERILIEYPAKKAQAFTK